MNQIGNIVLITNPADASKNAHRVITEEDKEKTAQTINFLFGELKSIFPAFKQAWPTDEHFNRAKLSWVKAFLDAGIINLEQLRYGIKKCRLSDSPFLPSVGQFMEWCVPTPEEAGFPPVHEAFGLADKINRLHENYIHPHAPTDTVIRHAISQIGPERFRSMKFEDALKTFTRYYAISVKQMIQGKLEIIKRALPEKRQRHPDDKARADAARDKAMDDMRRMGLKIPKRDEPISKNEPIS